LPAALALRARHRRQRSCCSPHKFGPCCASCATAGLARFHLRVAPRPAALVQRRCRADPPARCPDPAPGPGIVRPGHGGPDPLHAWEEGQVDFADRASAEGLTEKARPWRARTTANVVRGGVDGGAQLLVQRSHQLHLAHHVGHLRFICEGTGWRSVSGGEVMLPDRGRRATIAP
jgi:hypothetical protein